jgi:hypothetical protein
MNVTIRIDDQDLKDFLSVMNKMNKEANKELKDEVMDISRMTATALRLAAISPRQKIIADTIQARYDRIPTISIGGSKKITSYKRGGGTVGDILFGVEFGARRALLRNGGRAFPPRSAPTSNGGSKGYWLFPTLTKLQPEIRRRWYQAVDNLIDDWSTR